MFRYVAVIWDPTAGGQTETARTLTRRLHAGSSDWTTVLAQDGMVVCCADIRRHGSRAYTMHASVGVVLGTLFRRRGDASSSAGAAPASIDENESHRVRASQGRRLIENYWGRYVAFLTDASGHQLVVRSPTGSLPCFMTHLRGVSILFSYAADCTALGLPPFSINWSYVATRVALGHSRHDETALNEVSEVYCGESVEFRTNGQRRRFYWHPFEIVRAGLIEDPREAADAVRSAAKSCTHAWAAEYGAIIHRLSGGVDSSIVLGCLQDAPSRPAITSLNYYWRGARSADERAYARLSAERAGCELIERERTPERIRLDELHRLAPTINPLPHPADLETTEYERLLANERRAMAVSNGDPGDALFCKHDMNLAVTDFVQVHGLRPGLFSLAASVAVLEQTSIWRLLRAATRDGFSGRGMEPNKAIFSERKLVNLEVQRALLVQGLTFHPWFTPAEDIPPAKLVQIRSVLGGTEFFYVPSGHASDPEQVSPLRSEPLVEVCLRIPTYVHLHGGRDRGLARHAFASDVPKEILIRSWKGRPGRISRQALMHHIGLARELLLDGVLVKEGVLDRGKVESALDGRLVKDGSHDLELFEYMLVEAWAKTWITDKQRAAA